MSKQAQVQELRSQGYSMQRISDEVGIAKSTVSRWLNPVKPEKKGVTAETRNLLSAAARKGNAARVYVRKNVKDLRSPVLIRQRLFEKRGRVCEKCGWAEVNPTTNVVPVEVHHIDGDRQNTDEANLIILCPNCHSLTPNYMFHGRKRAKKVLDKDIVTV